MVEKPAGLLFLQQDLFLPGIRGIEEDGNCDHDLEPSLNTKYEVRGTKYERALPGIWLKPWAIAVREEKYEVRNTKYGSNPRTSYF